MPRCAGFQTSGLVLAAALVPGRGVTAQHTGSADSLSLLPGAGRDSQTLMTPIRTMAGLDPDATHVYLAADDSINAFFADVQNIFINCGLVRHAKTKVEDFDDWD